MKPETKARPLRDAGLAIGLLTVLPVGRRWPEAGQPDIAGYFPLVGLVVGAMGGLSAWALNLLPAARVEAGTGVSLLIAALVLVVQAAATRLLHWDALADLADGLWGAPDRATRLAIMRDSHIGAFGVAAMILVALVQITAFAILVSEQAFLSVVLAAALGRYAATFGAWFGSAARDTGLGAAVARRPAMPSAIFAGIFGLILCAASWTAGMSVFIVTVCGIGVALVVPHVLASEVGGVTGDVLGAAIMITETIVLVGLALGS